MFIVIENNIVNALEIKRIVKEGDLENVRIRVYFDDGFYDISLEEYKRVVWQLQRQNMLEAGFANEILRAIDSDLILRKK